MANYDKSIDYMALINEAIQRGDYLAAAKYEQQRNEKIKGEGITDYKPTSDYLGNLDTTDYSLKLKQMMNAGASVDDVRAILDKRTNKANSAKNLEKYAYDDVYKRTNDYINQKSLEDLTYADAPEYISRNQEAIDLLKEQILNSSYSDFLNTDEYAALDRSYTRDAQRAMQDTLGDVSARTGGLASSYGVTAGQQAYGNQMSTLERAALDMYSKDRTDKLNDMQMLLGLEGMDYGKYQDQLGQYNVDRGFGYGTIQDRLNREYQQAIDEKEWNYMLQQDEQAKLEDRADIMAGIGRYNYLQQLYDLSPDDVAALSAAYAAAQYSGVSSGGRSRGGGRSVSKKKDNTPQVTSSFYKKFGESRYSNAGNAFSSSKLKQFIEYVGRHRGDQGRYTAVENALDEGKITESQANKILAQFGIG